ncbi:hypothetical protein VC60_gp01 [Mycobacterium phage Sbash]|uniref:Terminase small subunit n=1 Tax=Mycobacterium phage Sbash TaxID=1567475 RepID=A0A0A7RXQ7_9CAUD|nr:hypothetical protein VC60_gp01 [Mycobacterium phage Sbash]AJA43302.1 hypothetical protein PBI_SBASH_1 [Mycobacterium phage Sbash]
MTRSCVVCGTPFEAKRPQAKFCGATCRKRHSRGASTSASTPQQPQVPTTGAPEVTDPTPSAAMPPLLPAAGLVATVVKELTAAGRMETVLGQQALRLAMRLETSTVDTGAGLASLSKELRAVMAQAVAGAAVEADPVDELRARRDAKRASAG